MGELVIKLLNFLVDITVIIIFANTKTLVITFLLCAKPYAVHA